MNVKEWADRQNDCNGSETRHNRMRNSADERQYGGRRRECPFQLTLGVLLVCSDANLSRARAERDPVPQPQMRRSGRLIYANMRCIGITP